MRSVSPLWRPSPRAMAWLRSVMSEGSSAQSLNCSYLPTIKVVSVAGALGRRIMSERALRQSGSVPNCATISETAAKHKSSTAL